MLLQAVLKCSILYFLFVTCATKTVKHMRTSNVDNRIRSLRVPVELNHQEQEDSKFDHQDSENTLNQEIEAAAEDEADEKNVDSQQSPKVSKCHGKKKLNANGTDESSECSASPENDDSDDSNEGNSPVTKMKLDLTGSSADKFLEMAKLASIPGYDFSTAEMNKFKLWPRGIIPFYIDEFSYDKVLRDNIREYLDQVNSLTGLRFLELPRPPVDDISRWVFIINRRGQLECIDYNVKSFTNIGVQKLVIGYDCLGGGGQQIAPTVLALAGVPPQHNSPDRDKFIKISMKSIQPDKTQLFQALNAEDWLFYDIRYDFRSAGHYPSHKYTSDGSATIQPLKPGTLIGEADGLSYTDVLKIRILYNFIVSRDDNNAKLPDCKTLYRPGPKFKVIEPALESSLITRKKPKQYLEAAQKAGIEVVDGSEKGHVRPKSKNIDSKKKSDEQHDVDDKSIQDIGNDQLNENNDNQSDNAAFLNGEENEDTSKELLKSSTFTEHPMDMFDTPTSSE